jgi:hypothetical protein
LARALTPARAGLAVGLIAFAGGALTLNHDLVGVFYDDGLYAGLAFALGHGLGYVHPHLPGTPAAIHYPPLYPLVLAPLFGSLAIETAAFAAKLLNLVLAALGAGLVAWYATRVNLLGDRAPSWLAAALVAASALAMPVLAVQAVLFAEPLFGVWLAATMILAGAPPPRWSSTTAAALAGLAAALALLTRSLGVTAAVGVALYLAVVRRAAWVDVLAAVAGVAVAAAGWGAWVMRHAGSIDPALAMNYGSYFATVRQAGLGVFRASARDLPRPLADLVLGGLPTPLYYLLGAVALAIGLYGLARILPRSPIGFTLLCYFAILALWPFPPDRFLWAVLPWLVLVWAAGALSLLERPALRIPVLVLVVTMVAGYGWREVRGFAGRWWGLSASNISDNFRELLPWVSTLPPGSVLATDDEALVWLYTHKAAVPLYLYGYRGSTEVRPTPAEHRAYLERQGVTHILLAGFGGGSAAELDALLGAYPGWLKIIHRWPGGRTVFQVADSIHAGRLKS